MFFPWQKYEEFPVGRRNTLQIFLTNRCNLNCNGCFAREVMSDGNEKDISLKEYNKVIEDFERKGGKQINLLGGEPLMHPLLREFIKINRNRGIKTTIYSNGYFLDKYSKEDLKGAKVRISLYCKTGKTKSLDSLPKIQENIPFEICFMVSKSTALNELLETADKFERDYNGKVFFISSLRELDNSRKEFFDDTELSMNVLDYKELVHKFLEKYEGNMEIHISKRGVFESTLCFAENKCHFANYIIGGKIIQCPYDLINKKFQSDYNFGVRNCQQNNTCLMSKVVFKRKS